MNIPKGFAPKTNEKNLIQLIEGSKIHKIRVNKLLQSCEEFIREGGSRQSINWYELGKDLSEKIEYTKYDLEGLSKKLEIKWPQDPLLGFYLSALVNKIITAQDFIILKPKLKLVGLGTYLERGVLRIEQDLNSFAGTRMKGGTLIIDGSVNYNAGEGMQGGFLQIHKCAGRNLGQNSKGGIIRVYGTISDISPNCKAKVYLKKEQVWPK